MKTPDEIKKGLVCCIGDDMEYHCEDCPYHDCDERCRLDGTSLYEDTLAYIQQLESATAELLTKCERLERERDALLEMTEKECYTCKHNFGNAQDRSCIECDGESKWQWIGVKEE